MQQKPERKTWRNKIYDIIYDADTPAGKAFDIVLLIVILISVLFVMLESVDGLDPWIYRYLHYAEWVVTGLFSIEYISRIISTKKPYKYIFSFYGIIDFLSTIPLYLSIFLSGGMALITIRALRLLRVFRILKVNRYVGESNHLKEALKKSLPKISVFLFAVIIISMIAGTVLYLVEGADSGFTSIPISIYWCIVTLTTVGFGDIHPVTPLGQFLAALIMIMGYGIIAVPTGIVGAEYSKVGQEVKAANKKFCYNCEETSHKDEANYCHSCGEELTKPDTED